MITWLRIWPLMLLPFFVVLLLGLIPSFSLKGSPFGGPVIREWFFNNTVLPFYIFDSRQALVDWYMQTDLTGEIFTHILVSFNIFAALLPITYLLSKGLITLSAWYNVTDLQQKRNAIR